VLGREEIQPLSCDKLAGMPSRRKLNWDRINELQLTTCPHCDSKMQIADCKRVDGEHLECSRCGKRFITGAGKSG